jgi:hypothetical protein
MGKMDSPGTQIPGFFVGFWDQGLNGLVPLFWGPLFPKIFLFSGFQGFSCQDYYDGP